jgi:hypothetical protein
MTSWPCPVPGCREPHGLALPLVATPEAYAREHQGVLPDAAQLADWQRRIVTRDVERHLAGHPLADLARIACAPGAHRESLAHVPNPGTVAT